MARSRQEGGTFARAGFEDKGLMVAGPLAIVMLLAVAAGFVSYPFWK